MPISPLTLRAFGANSRRSALRAAATLARRTAIATTLFALPALLARRPEVQRAILARVTANLRTLDDALASHGEGLCLRLAVEGGWYAILDVPRTRTEDEWVDRLLDAGAIVHPGYFFELDREGYLVISLLPREADFAAAIARVVRAVAAG